MGSSGEPGKPNGQRQQGASAEKCKQLLPPLPPWLAVAVRGGLGSRDQLLELLATDGQAAAILLALAAAWPCPATRPVSDLSEALDCLGAGRAEQLLLALDAYGLLAGELPAFGIAPGALWQHSVAVASGAATITARSGGTRATDAYLAGILHDCGLLLTGAALANEPGGRVQEAIELSSLVDAEDSLAGLDHERAGGAQAEGWALPPASVEAIAHHHSPSGAGRLAAILHVADAVAMAAGLGLWADSPRWPLDRSAFEALDWHECEDAPAISEAMHVAVREARRMLRLDGALHGRADPAAGRCPPATGVRDGWQEEPPATATSG